MKDVEEMVLAFPTLQYYQFELPEPGRHDLLLTQLTPNVISYILAFIILCEDKAVEATSCLFNTVFSLVEEPGKTGYSTVEPKAGFKLVQDLSEAPAI
ncbi:hypothetical protein Dimus_015742 [Dionaea muscipula]